MKQLMLPMDVVARALARGWDLLRSGHGLETFFSALGAMLAAQLSVMELSRRGRAALVEQLPEPARLR